ncbi:MAG: porin family protein [Bacteroidetes bacterium]|nr:porin family protein [Bacteroidota bacterium]
MKNFRIILLALSISFVFQLSSQAQNRIFKKGQMDASISIGLVPTFFADKGKMMLPPLSVGADYRIARKFSLGMYAGKSITESARKVFHDSMIAQWKNNFTTLGLRGTVHFTERENLDIYGGFLLIYNHSNIEIMEGKEEILAKHLGIKPTSSTLAYSGFVGTRYALNKELSVFGEIGYGVSLAKVGISFRLF